MKSTINGLFGKKNKSFFASLFLNKFCILCSYSNRKGNCSDQILVLLLVTRGLFFYLTKSNWNSFTI